MKKDRSYGQPLCVIFLVVSEQGAKGVVTGNDEASEVGKELTTQVEDDHEEVEGGETDYGIGLGDTGLLLEVVDGRVLGELHALRVSTDKVM